MKHILIVDDNKTTLTAARSVLSSRYKVTPVTSAAQALKFLEISSCDLILLDVNMPEMDGLALLGRIRENPLTADIPVIFLTADTDAETETHCLDAGAMDFIAKPFVPEVMISRIERVLELEDVHRMLSRRLEEEQPASPEALLAQLCADPAAGAYRLSFESFRHVYQFIRRFAERSGTAVQTILFTLGPGCPAPETAMQQLEQAISLSLRRADVSTRCADDQILVVLMNADPGNADGVARRILDRFRSLAPAETAIRYRIAELGSDPDDLTERRC